MIQSMKRAPPGSRSFTHRCSERMISKQDMISTVGEEQMPAKRPADLPSFERPPVNEVVLSIQFASLPLFRNVHGGLLWERFRNDYPDVSEQPPLPVMFETFGGMQTPPPAFEFQALLTPPIARFLFEASDGRELVQIQPDRILHNWRKKEEGDEYPRYEAIRSRFQDEVAKLADFLAAENLGDLRPNQCEVIYVNTIELPEGGDPYGSLQRVTPLWSGALEDGYTLDVEQTNFDSRFVLKDGDRPYGRLYVSFRPAIRQGVNRRVIRLDITVRARPIGDTVENAFETLDIGREFVVRTFAAVTTPEMWEYWGRERAER